MASDSAREEKKKASIAVWAAAAANIGIAIAKFTAAYFTGSSAMLSEGIHSAVDTGNELFLLIGERKSRRPADSIHQFGYGRDIYFWTLLVGVLIFGAGGGLSLFEGIDHLFHPTRIEDPAWLFATLFAAIIFEGSSLLVGVREYRKVKPLRKISMGLRGTDDPTVFAVVVEDSAALVGLAIALVGVSLSLWLQNPFFDALSSILIGVLLMTVAIFMIHEARELLIGEGLDPAALEEIRKRLLEDPSVGEIFKILSTHIAPGKVLLVVDLKLANVITAQDVRSAIRRLNRTVKKLNRQIQHVYIETQPTEPA